MTYAKTLTSAVTTAMALMATIGVASASASTFNTTVPNVPIEGVQGGHHVFTSQGQEVTCEVGRLVGTAEGTSSEHLRLHPIYEGCTAFGFEATVNTDGCIFNFTANTTLPNEKAEVNLESCTSGHVTILVDIGIATCEVQVPNQNGINGVHYVNTAGDSDVVFESTNIASNVTRDAGLCPLHLENGAITTYVGTFTLTPASGELFWKA